LATKQAALFFTNSSPDDQSYYSQNPWPQNNWHYCFTNNIAPTIVFISHIHGHKISGIIVSEIAKPKQSQLLFTKCLATKQAALLFHK
jgi:hypothetical protein